MSWMDRVQEAAYTAPSGNRQTFTYEDVSRSVEKKTSAFDFPDADGTYVQDLGHTGRRYPLRMIFWGENYDLEAASFEALLLERGIGVLEHPAYGSVDVVPFGAITRRDDLKTRANQAVIECELWETIDLVYPTSQAAPENVLEDASVTFSQSAADQFGGSVVLERASERVSLKNIFATGLTQTRSALRTLSDNIDGIRKQMNDGVRAVNSAIDDIIARPADLAFQAAQLVQLPARATSQASARISAYEDLITAIITGGGSAVVPGYDERESNTVRTQDLYASAAVSGAALGALSGDIETRVEALTYAEGVLNLFDTVVAWRDGQYEVFALVDTGETYRAMLDSVSACAAYLLAYSLSLKVEKAIVLDRARTLVDLAGELFGDISDTRLDEIINANRLTGAEILELPKGRRVVYHV